MPYIDEEISFDSSLEEKYEYIRNMQENGIKDRDILIPMTSEKMVGDRKLIELISATEFLSRYPYLSN